MSKVRVLMFGWDFPPMKVGGLGVACHGLTEELIKQDVDVVFVLPRMQEVDSKLKFVFAGVEGSKLRPIDSPLVPYQSSNSYVTGKDGNGLYVHSLIDEVLRYADKAKEIARSEDFDVIHAHDWTSYLAGIEAKRATGKPLVLHVHATSHDQAGGRSVDPAIYEIEAKAFAEADKIVAISNYTKEVITKHHKPEPKKIEVVHNGTERVEKQNLEPVLSGLKSLGKKIVLYHGRVTIQKGPDYFVKAARMVRNYNEDVYFVVSGWGDMLAQMVREVADLGMSDRFIFARNIWGEERDRLYQSADVLVMPSVSEPFGLVPLECLQQGTPVIISRQSGVAEVLQHALKVDFWDTDQLANQILAITAHTPLAEELARNGEKQSRQMTWEKPATEVKGIYQSLLRSSYA